MKVLIATKTNIDLYAVAGTYTEQDGTETCIVNFYLSDDPVEGITPVQVPHPPACITVDFPAEPYFNPPPNHSLMVGKYIDPATGDLHAAILGIMDDEDPNDPGVSAPKGPPN